jgi:peptidase E
MAERSPALDRYVLELTGKPVPKICFLPTASGDERTQVVRFYERFSPWPCEPSALSLFHLGRDRIDPVRHLLAQDAIYAGGGSMRNMLAIWREHGLDQVMRAAWHAGVVLAGLSAGAMCWFRAGISMSGGRAEAVPGLALVSASLSVHRDGEPLRLPAFRKAVAEGRLPTGYAVDDSAALLYRGDVMSECVASRAGAGVSEFRLGPDGVSERPLPVRVLPEADSGTPLRTSVARTPDETAVSELRTLRAGRHRWD